jgi:predicted naringenin-chalcone synthase
MVRTLNLKLGDIPSGHLFALLAALRDAAGATELSVDTVEASSAKATSVDVLAPMGPMAAVQPIRDARSKELALAEEAIDLLAIARQSGFLVPSLPERLAQFIELPFS